MPSSCARFCTLSSCARAMRCTHSWKATRCARFFANPLTARLAGSRYSFGQLSQPPPNFSRHASKMAKGLGAAALGEELGLVAAPGLELDLRRLARRTQCPRERRARRGVDLLLAPPDVEVALSDFSHLEFGDGARIRSGSVPELMRINV